MGDLILKQLRKNSVKQTQKNKFTRELLRRGVGSFLLPFQSKEIEKKRLRYR